MQISYNWLTEYLKVNVSVAEIEKILTDIGLEVGGVEETESIKGGLKGFVIGEVVEKWQHPNADKLSCTKVNIGKSELLDIVCGASNVAAGQKVVVATEGTVVYTDEGSFTIKKSKLRGEPSEGMICAEDEIGIGKGHEGILVLPNDVAVGTLAADYFKVSKDTVLEVDITPNRADALSHVGVARDLAAYFQSHKTPVIFCTPAVENKGSFKSNTQVKITDSEACPYYSGVEVKGVKVKPSPDWLKNRLQSIGLKSINNVVDISNFVMHELGQPLHIFDLNKIEGNTVVVGKGKNEKFVALDDTEVNINPNDLVICNANNVMCIAGVFGGKHSGVQENTIDVFVESAYFNPIDVRVSSKRHNFKTDSSYRFERGVNPQMVQKALLRCVELLFLEADAQAASEIIKAGQLPASYFDVDFRPSFCNKLLGTELSNETILSILKALEIEADTSAEIWKLKVPSYRVDVKREVDVVEDILRIYGYNNVEIPQQFKASVNYTNSIPHEIIRKQTADFLASNGFNEILNNSLTKKSYFEENNNLVELLNPLSQDLSVMRPTMLYGGLESVSRNINMKMSDIRFFEFGKTYAKNGDGAYNEQQKLSFWLSGNHNTTNWLQTKKSTDYYQLNSFVTSVLDILGVEGYKIKEYESTIFDYGMCYAKKKNDLVILGKVNSKIAQKMGIKQDVFFADFNWDALVAIAQYKKSKFQALPKFHPVKRDLSLLLEGNVTYQSLVDAVKETEKNLLQKVDLLDVYQGDKLPANKKSYTLSFTLQSEEKTLEDKDIEKVMQKLLNMFAQKFNAELR
jgi:phenylalanyl-tRNA synthetase beta chain